MLKKIFIFIGVIAAIIGIAIYSFPQFGRTIKCIVAAGSTEVGLGWSVKQDPGEAVKEAIAMALKGKRNKNPNIAIMFVSADNNMSVINSKAEKLLDSGTKIYGGASDPESLANNNRGYIYINKKNLKKKSPEEKRGIVIITISSREVIFGVGSSDLSESGSVRAAAKTALLKAIASAGKCKERYPKLVFLLSTPNSEKEAISATKQTLNRSNIILCGSAGKNKFCMFGEKKVLTSGVSMAVVYTNLPIGLNIIKRSYEKIEKPPTIKELLTLRSL